MTVTAEMQAYISLYTAVSLDELASWQHVTNLSTQVDGLSVKQLHAVQFVPNQQHQTIRRINSDKPVLLPHTR